MGEVADPTAARARPPLRCPACRRGALEVHADEVRCPRCGVQFGRDDRIPLLYWPDDDRTEGVTERVKAFYEETPFPNYDDVDSPETLRAKASGGLLAAALEKELEDDASVLEIGCGTGQLINFLALGGGRTVVGADVCLNSLRLADGFAHRHGIDNIEFVQMNVFRPVFAPDTFDLVICNGVLHHTADPFKGFTTMVSLAKHGGLVLVGLYNRYGRLLTNVRRKLFDATGDRGQFLDRRLRGGAFSERKRRTWFMDQYKHPHESQHTYGETLDWFSRCGVDFVSSLPPLDRRTGAGRRLLEPTSPGSTIARMRVQATMAAADHEAGFYVMIGRKR